MRVPFTLTVLLLSSGAFAEGQGLRPDTPDELREMHRKGMRKIKKVNLSPIGLERANAERRKRGLAELPASEARAFGRDTEVDKAVPETDAFGADASGSVSFGSTVLPTAVDNSLLPSFPVVRSQGSINSCVSWATGYYQNTHHHGLALGWINNTTDNAKKCSPKFIYNHVNGGANVGTSFSSNYAVLQNHGCTSWDLFPNDGNVTAWDLNADHWKSALGTRSLPPQYIYNLDTATGLQQAKELLNNGYVLVFGTYINSFVYKPIGSNPSLASNPLAGKNAVVYLNGTNGAHAMTFVGYDDNAWVDMNGNGAVDAGESGVFKIANSWGTGYGYGGFYYMTYDSIKSVSGVAGAPAITGRTSSLQSKMVYHQPVRAVAGAQYAPKYVAKVTLKHPSRNQLAVRFGYSTTSATSPVNSFYPSAVASDGGAFGLDGVAGSLTQGSFSFDLSDLPISDTAANRIYLTVTDSVSGSPAELSSFEIIDVLSSRVVTYMGQMPLSIDGSSKTIYVDLVSANVNQLPIASFTNSGSVGPAPLVVNFDASSSFDPDGSIASYSWTFGDGTSASGAQVSKTYSVRGIYSAVLIVKDNKGASSSTSLSIDTRDKIAPVVSLTSPVNGAKVAARSTISMAASASDNFGVTKVDFLVNGKVICSDSAAPYTCSSVMPNGKGSVSVQAKAYDGDGNVGSSAIASVSSK